MLANSPDHDPKKTAPTPPVARLQGAKWFTAGFTVSVLTAALFVTCCGLLEDALPTSTLGALFCWIPFTRYRRIRIYHKLLAGFLVIFSSEILLVNVFTVFRRGIM